MHVKPFPNVTPPNRATQPCAAMKLELDADEIPFQETWARAYRILTTRARWSRGIYKQERFNK